MVSEEHIGNEGIFGRAVFNDVAFNTYAMPVESHDNRISSVIDAHPTAYDPDKVVKQLEELTDEMEQFNCTGMLSDIIEVVKAGGVNG